jgi:hypothetical protein
VYIIINGKRILLNRGIYTVRSTVRRPLFFFSPQAIYTLTTSKRQGKHRPPTTAPELTTRSRPVIPCHNRLVPLSPPILTTVCRITLAIGQAPFSLPSHYISHRAPPPTSQPPLTARSKCQQKPNPAYPPSDLLCLPSRGSRRISWGSSPFLFCLKKEERAREDEEVGFIVSEKKVFEGDRGAKTRVFLLASRI